MSLGASHLQDDSHRHARPFVPADNRMDAPLEKTNVSHCRSLNSEQIKPKESSLVLPAGLLHKMILRTFFLRPFSNGRIVCFPMPSKAIAEIHRGKMALTMAPFLSIWDCRTSSLKLEIARARLMNTRQTAHTCAYSSSRAHHVYPRDVRLSTIRTP
jgi:hypothetical protein